MRLLFVDDAPEMRALAQRAFDPTHDTVRVAASCAEARVALRDELPEVLILDVALADGNGVVLCQELRGRDIDVPILLLTAHGDVGQRVAGLDAGADDFLTKPFAMAELRARIRALARRGPWTRPSLLRVGDVALDASARRAWRGGDEVPVTRREWAVLDLLLARRGDLVRREHILEAAWGEDTASARASLDTILSRLRRKLGSDVVETVRGQGHAIRLDP